MEWKAKWINPQLEPTYRAMTLVLTDELGQDYRVDKIFPAIEISGKELSEIAAKEIQIIEAEIQPVAPVATTEE